ncbi:MAG TPA: rhodanese-like domain-containing protein [Terriglobia bacterium]|nr:rhodanese-like domain-containing protein [Terriglobia bacterium]
MSTLLSRIFGRKKSEPAPAEKSGLDVSALKPLMSPKEFAEVHARHTPPETPGESPAKPDELSGAWRMSQVLEAFPSAQRALFQKYHIGGCSSCGYEPSDTLASVARSHGVEPEEIVRFIKESAGSEKEIEITPAETVELLSRGAIRLVDVRTPHEYAIARIEGSDLIDQSLLQEITHSWPKDTPIVTVCHHGVRSLDAAAYLRGHGMKNVRSMRGGIDAWSLLVDSNIPRY